MCSRQAKHLLCSFLPCTPGRTMLQLHVWCIEASLLFTHLDLISNSQVTMQLCLEEAWN